MTNSWRDPGLRTLRGIELLVRRRVEGPLHGDHRGLTRGLGSEPGDARSYEVGDDVRRIDWTVTARTAHPHVRDTIADRDLDVAIALDLSGSMGFGTQRRRKRDLAVTALGAVAWLGARGSGRIGVLVLGEDQPRWRRVRAHRDALGALLAEIDRVPTGPAADLADGLTRLAGLARRRGLVVVLSDFLGPADWVRPLRVLASRHDVLAVELIDPRELELPDVGYVVVEDAETGRRRSIDTSRAGTRDAFARAAADRRAALAGRIGSTGASHLVLRTDGDPVADLARYLRARKRAPGAWLRPPAWTRPSDFAAPDARPVVGSTGVPRRWGRPPTGEERQ